MKKLILSALAICSIFAMNVYIEPVHAIDFSKNEAKYIKICSSSSLTQSKKKTCEEFNAYLSKKNKELKNEIQSTKNDLNKTSKDIEKVTQKIKEIVESISVKEAEIDYLLSSITKIKRDIVVKEEQMQERLYVMQTQYNSNQLIDFLFGAEDFTDFFSRLASINDITAYEKELVDELTRQKKALDQQKTSLLNAKEALQQQKRSQIAYQDQLIDLKVEQQKTIEADQQKVNANTAAQKKIDAALSALMQQAPSGGGGGGSYVPGSSAVGNAIAQKALTRLGSRYWWGAPGGAYGDGQGLDNPNAHYFDCSGLVAWAHRQSGVRIGRSNAAGYAASGIGLTKDQLQPGDVITFNYGSGIAHIGIYIGGGSFVHAAGDGSGTWGQYPNQCVKVAKLAGYWESHVYNYRRLY